MDWAQWRRDRRSKKRRIAEPRFHQIVSCELTIEDIMDSYVDFYGGLSERREEPPPTDAVPTALHNEHQTRAPLALMGRACW